MEERLMKTTVDRKICQGRPEARLVLLAALLSLLSLQSAHAAVTVDISFFHDRLAPYGNWIEHQRYGWVWQPTVVDVSWRPYTDGSFCNDGRIWLVLGFGSGMGMGSIPLWTLGL
jgi:hypothetical protein